MVTAPLLAQFSFNFWCRLRDQCHFIIWRVICYCSVTQVCLTLCDSIDCNTPGFSVCYQLQSSFKLMSIESVIPSNQLILCYPLLLLPSVLPSIRVFSSESVLHIRRPKYWSFNFSINLPMNIQD